MREDDARQLFLVRAIEKEDTEHLLLTREDRQQADRAARQAIESSNSKNAPENYLAGRSRFAVSRLATRHPSIARVLKGSMWPSWLSLNLPIAALVLGLLTNELGNGNRLQLLAFPLIGAIAWNLFVYIGLFANLFRSSKTPRKGIWERLGKQIAGLGGIRSDSGPPLARGLTRFWSKWTKASSRLMALRSARTFHIAAAMFATGLICGIFLRALAVEYNAGWESTFLGPDAVHRLLWIILGPASALTGIPIPGVEAIADLRWTGAEESGTNAGPWIILYTATALAFIVFPRLILAGIASARASLAARNFPVPGREDFYIRKLLRGVSGGAGAVRVTPYAYRPDEDAKLHLAALIREALGDGTTVEFDPPVDYGAEDIWVETEALREGIDHHIALFTLSATPEDENHGEFVRGLKSLVKGHASIAAIVDESAFRAHFAGQSGLADRIGTRSTAWQAVIATAGAQLLTIDLSAADPALERERFEALLVQNAALEALGLMERES